MIKKMSLRRNFAANLTSAIWTALLGLIVVPFYLDYLGIEAYGLIGFFVTLQALFQLFDLGITPTVNREVARAVANDELQKIQSTLGTLEYLYWIMAALILVVAVILFPIVSRNWLDAKTLSMEGLHQSMLLMGIAIASRWPAAFYAGVLTGAEKLVLLSVINILTISLANIGVIAVLALVSPTLQAFFIWQSLMGVVYVILLRYAAIKISGKPAKRKFEISELKRVWKFSAGMSGIAISSIVLTQLDKVLLSKTLGLEALGYYMIAKLAASGLYIFVTPLFNVIYPRFSALVSTNDSEQLKVIYRIGSSILASVLFPIALALAYFAVPAITLWTQSPMVSSHVAPIVFYLALGSGLHGIMYFPYTLQIAYGRPKIPLLINLFFMVLLVPSLIYLSATFGPTGGAIAWMIMECLYVVIGTWLTGKLVLEGTGFSWLIVYVGLPLLISSLVVGVGANLLKSFDLNEYSILTFASMLVLVSAALSLWAMKKLHFSDYQKFRSSFTTYQAA